MTRYQPSLKFSYLAPQYRGEPLAREFESCLGTTLDWFPSDFDGWGWNQPIPDGDEWDEVVSEYNRQLMASC